MVDEASPQTSDQYWGQELTEYQISGVALEVAMKRRNSLPKTEGDTEVILADVVIATILLKGKL